MSAGPDTSSDDCLWPLDRARRADRGAGRRRPGSRGSVRAERFELSYADVAPVLVAAGARRGAGGPARRQRRGRAPGDRRLRGRRACACWPRAARSSFARARRCRRCCARRSRRRRRRASRRRWRRRASPGARAESVRAALLAAALGGERVAEGARLRPAQRSIGTALRAAGVGRRLAAALARLRRSARAARRALGTVGTRAVVGEQPRGRRLGLDRPHRAPGRRPSRPRRAPPAGWRSTPARCCAIAILHGLLRLDTEPLRAAGIGRLMGRVADVEAVESLALGGGLTAAVGHLRARHRPLRPRARRGAGRPSWRFAAGWGLLGAALAVRVQRALRRLVGRAAGAHPRSRRAHGRPADAGRAAAARAVAPRRGPRARPSTRRAAARSIARSPR